MRNRAIHGAILTLALVWTAAACGGSRPGGAFPSPGRRPPPEPSTLSAILLEAPAEEASRRYLGLNREGLFRLDEVAARILLIEVFSMYCPYCQQEAPQVNRLFQAIEDDPRLRGQIKLVGLGVGNTAYEVALFRETYGVPFPLFPDSERRAAGQLQVRRTPSFVAFALDDDGSVRQFHHSAGPLGDVEAFLQRMVTASGLKGLEGP